MKLKRIVGIITTNPHKVEEIGFDLAYYDISVERLDEYDPSFLQPRDTDTYRIRPLAIIREQTSLLGNGWIIITDPMKHHLESVCHSSVLEVWLPDGTKKQYDNDLFGTIDITRRSKPSTNIFGWDDIFMVKGIFKSYQELKGLNHKYSARDKVMSEFIQEHIHYKKNIDLVHFPQNYDEVVDFNKDPAKFIRSVAEYSNPIATQMLLTNIPITALNNGMFFRSAKNRRQKLYWCPGLNAGIPFVPKPKDPIHERTFMFHDLSHFCIPDLVYDGGLDPTTRKVYIGYRLMSEAITLVLADMLFVHSMIESGYEYKTVDGRKIYPLFKHMNKPSIYELLRGSYEYCFYGDTSRWLGLMDGSDAAKEALAQFTGKYDKYFLEDFRWTRLNYDNMTAHNNQCRNWWNSIKTVRDKHNIQLYSVSEWIERLPQTNTTRELNDAVFQSVYSHFIKPLFSGGACQLKSFEERQQESIIRYMMGQMRIFWRFKELYPQTEEIIKTLINTLKMDRLEPDNIRNFYEYYLNDLHEVSLISYDDICTYKQVYPIFNPYIVDYDNMNSQTTLEDFMTLMLEGD